MYPSLPRFYLLFSKECAQFVLILKQLNILPLELIHLINILYIKSHNFDHMQLAFNSDTYTLLHKEKIYLWGFNSPYDSKPIRFDTDNVGQISCNEASLILKSDGLFAYGRNHTNQISDSNAKWFSELEPIVESDIEPEDIVSIGTGNFFSVIVTNKCIYTRGRDFPRYAITRRYFGRDNNRVRFFFGITSGAIIANIQSGVTDMGNELCLKVKCGHSHIILLTSSGAYSWGANSNGQLGLGDYNNRNAPCKINLDNIVDIDAGFYHSALIVYDDSSKEYHLYECGQLGENNFPKRINLNGSVISVSCNYGTTMCLTTDGLYHWNMHNLEPTKINIPNVIIICEGDTLYDNHAVITKNHRLITWDSSLKSNINFSWNESNEHGFKTHWLDLSDIERTDLLIDQIMNPADNIKNV